jgi:hypothetical protein
VKIRKRHALSPLAFGAPYEDAPSPLAAFLRDPSEAKRTGLLPLAPPTRDGRPWSP